MLLYTITSFEAIMFQVISLYYFRKMGESPITWIGDGFSWKVRN